VKGQREKQTTDGGRRMTDDGGRRTESFVGVRLALLSLLEVKGERI